MDITQETANGSSDLVPAKRGRPSRYTEELAHTICCRIAEGESLRKICRDEDMPDKSTVLRWLGAKERAEFRDQYAGARDLQADMMFDEALEISNNSEGDLIETEDGKPLVNHANVQRSRLRVDTLKWAAGKLAPKRYGDRVNLDHSGNVGITHEQALKYLE